MHVDSVLPLPFSYKEKDAVRGDDSFLAFEEVLATAREKEVRVVSPCLLNVSPRDIFRWRTGRLCAPWRRLVPRKPPLQVLHVPVRYFLLLFILGVAHVVDFPTYTPHPHPHPHPHPRSYSVMQMLRKHCIGDGDIKFQVKSDPKSTLVTGKECVKPLCACASMCRCGWSLTSCVPWFSFPYANYEDPNYNVALPVFSIHGNHDDPSRDGARHVRYPLPAPRNDSMMTFPPCVLQSLAAADILAVANLVNYFGKSERVDEVEISPVLLQKGATKVALYGLGSMRDERLNRMFHAGKVKFVRPTEDPDVGCVFAPFAGVSARRDARRVYLRACLCPCSPVVRRAFACRHGLTYLSFTKTAGTLAAAAKTACQSRCCPSFWCVCVGDCVRERAFRVHVHWPPCT